MDQRNTACVIGGSGFLGSHVADQLSDAGYDVVIFDRSPSPWLRSEQRMVIGDLLDLDAITAVTAGAQCVYNFAALADLNAARTRPLQTVQVNVLGAVNVMEACRINGVKRMVYASTVYVYSRDGGFYRCSKQAAEHYVEEYQRAYGLDYTILRYGSLYGPRADESNGLLRIVSRALESGVLKYEGSPDALREYIHVEDAARASVAALGDEFRNESVVLTGQEPMRVRDLLEMLAEILGFDGVQFVSGEQPGHYVRTPYAYQPKLGRKYVPPMHVDLGQGLLQLINDIQSRRAARDNK
ncbi:NAD-dependent epimerase/dehydratase family protein [Steroidobacter flavus]|uniref:NAD-dependent epimerase/dehydratase family protein n=1 Tax=Steroidobacter flavus TaxID=1842136 RepID=A0ABV8T380_9GAMM